MTSREDRGGHGGAGGSRPGGGRGGERGRESPDGAGRSGMPREAAVGGGTRRGRVHGGRGVRSTTRKHLGGRHSGLHGGLDDRKGPGAGSKSPRAASPRRKPKGPRRGARSASARTSGDRSGVGSDSSSGPEPMTSGNRGGSGVDRNACPGKVGGKDGGRAAGASDVLRGRGAARRPADPGGPSGDGPSGSGGSGGDPETVSGAASRDLDGSAEGVCTAAESLGG